MTNNIMRKCLHLIYLCIYLYLQLFLQIATAMQVAIAMAIDIQSAADTVNRLVKDYSENVIIDVKKYTTLKKLS